MGKFKLPKLTNAQRTGLTLDAREIVYDTDLDVLYYGDGATSGGLSLVGADGATGPAGPPGSGLDSVVDDLTPQLGGFLDPNGNYVGSEKGVDIASSSPLVIGTDGDYFDINGTTGFSTITVAANRLFRGHFDGILTIVHGASINVPGGVNFTTAVGDEITFFSTAENVVRIVAITKADGTSPVGSGGAWNLIGTLEASNDATLTITGLDSTYDSYAVIFSDCLPATDATNLHMRFGDSSGIDSGASDYTNCYMRQVGISGSVTDSGSNSIDHIQVNFGSQVGNVSGEGTSGIFYLNRPLDANMKPCVTGNSITINGNGDFSQGLIMGGRNTNILLDRIQIFFQTGNIVSGRFSIWGISHA